jgi:DNA modification methylase
MSSSKTSIKTTDVVFRQDLYPRFKPNPSAIQEYAANLPLLPPIEIEQHNILIDGYHRWKAHETAGATDIPCTVTRVESEAHLHLLAVTRNAKHGQRLTEDEKKKCAILWWKNRPDVEIETALSISHRIFLDWTKAKREEQDKDDRRRVYELWMACSAGSAKDIAETIDRDEDWVEAEIAKIPKSDDAVDSRIFRNFTPEVYALWSFGKATNEVKHPGNIPPEIIDNLLWYYTKPFDVVFDPFGGGGSTIDKCLERKRRYYVSDLNPIPARADIRQHDITTGLPGGLPVPDLIFLDPPYWKQTEGKYSQDATDLANVDLETFLGSIGDIAKAIKRKWTEKHNGTLALIMGPWKDEGQYVDLPFLCYERIAKYLPLKQRICVPYSTQVHGGAYVKQAQERKEILYLTRDLMVFGR